MPPGATDGIKSRSDGILVGSAAEENTLRTYTAIHAQLEHDGWLPSAVPLPGDPVAPINAPEILLQKRL